MYEVELTDILESDTMGILLVASSWPSVLDNAIASMEHELTDREELKRLVRPSLYFVCRAFGPAHYTMPCGARARHFILEKRLYDLSLSDANAMVDLAAKKRLKKSDLAEIMLRQTELHSQMGQDKSPKSRKWMHNFIRVTDFMNRLLCQRNLAEKDKALVVEALLSGLANSRVRSVLQIPQCRKLAADIRDHLIIRDMKNGDVFMTARKFKLSPQAVYRIIKKDTEHRKEGDRHALTPA